VNAGWSWDGASGVDEIREFVGVAHEKHRRVLPDEIPIAFLGVELDGETAHIALGVGGADLARHRREALDQVGLLAILREDRRLGVLGDVFADRERAVGAQPLACTVRSGMRSRFWCASFSSSW